MGREEVFPEKRGEDGGAEDWEKGKKKKLSIS